MPYTPHDSLGNEPRFDSLGISPIILASLEKLGFSSPTPIQHQAIPPALENKDIVGIAQTGTGKTLAFGIPMLQRILATGRKGLVVLPTRELALQVEEELMKLGRGEGLRTAVLIGGASLGRQIEMIRRNPHIIVATPGRLIDHLEQKKITLDSVGVLVLDEADRMLDMGFAPQLSRILAVVPRDRQTMLFSATMPDAIMKIAATEMRLPLRIEVAPSGTVAEMIEQEIFVVRRDAKEPLLTALLTEYTGSVLVFSRTKHGAERIARTLKHAGFSAAEIHSNRSLIQRRAALDGFKAGTHRVLVATDIAARGIDVKNIEVVINYDLPDNPEDYVHRIGRTGRAGKHGRAISFATPDQGSDVRMIERLVRREIPVSVRASLTEERFDAHSAPSIVRRGGGRGGRMPIRRASMPGRSRPALRPSSRFGSRSRR